MSVRIWTIKISQWARANFCGYRKNVHFVQFIRGKKTIYQVQFPCDKSKKTVISNDAPGNLPTLEKYFLLASNWFTLFEPIRGANSSLFWYLAKHVHGNTFCRPLDMHATKRVHSKNVLYWVLLIIVIVILYLIESHWNLRYLSRGRWSAWRRTWRQWYCIHNCWLQLRRIWLC